MSEFAEKARSIAAPRRLGKSEVVSVPREDRPGTAGYHVKHWDGRQDGIATPPPITIKIGMEPKGDGE